MQSSQGHLHHMNEEVFEDAINEDSAETLIETSCNDTNEADLYYFAHMTNHYLRLIKSFTSPFKDSLVRSASFLFNDTC